VATTLSEYSTLAEMAIRHRLRINIYKGGDLEGPLRILEKLAERISFKDLLVEGINRIFGSTYPFFTVELYQKARKNIGIFVEICYIFERNQL
jgi:hypothetical protein